LEKKENYRITIFEKERKENENVKKKNITFIFLSEY